MENMHQIVVTLLYNIVGNLYKNKTETKKKLEKIRKNRKKSEKIKTKQKIRKQEQEPLKIMLKFYYIHVFIATSNFCF